MKENRTNERVVDVEPVKSVVVVYETLAAREQVVGFYEKFSSQSNPSVSASIAWYAFEDLIGSSKREKATQAAIEAHVLAFAINSIGDLSPEIKLWTEDWLLRRRGRGGLFVGLVSGGETEVRGVACLKEIYLRHLAHRAGMDYLSHFPTGPFRTLPDSLDSFNQKANRVTPLLDEILRARWVVHTPPLK